MKPAFGYFNQVLSNLLLTTAAAKSERVSHVFLIITLITSSEKKKKDVEQKKEKSRKTLLIRCFQYTSRGFVIIFVLRCVFTARRPKGGEQVAHVVEKISLFTLLRSIFGSRRKHSILSPKKKKITENETQPPNLIDVLKSFQV